jgi:tetratricopeptide (TPR) repeat protein
MTGRPRLLLRGLLTTAAVVLLAAAATNPLRALAALGPDDPANGLVDAQRAFYNGQYELAANLALAIHQNRPDDLAAYELRTAAILFRLKRTLTVKDDRGRNVDACEICPGLVAEFRQDTERAQALARERLVADPADLDARFFLGKINLNHVWLHLGTLGRRTGWNEYWEARRSLDAVLERDPDHVRANVARAWMDYIVATRLPWGTRWMLGGGNRGRALAAVRVAAGVETDLFTGAEATFALWEMAQREGNRDEATIMARRLARDFPENEEIARYLGDAE